MTLTVENGTGLSGADAFEALADVKARWDNLGHDWSAYSTAQMEQAIRRGSTWLSEAFAWKGTLVNGRSQALAWPRNSVVDNEGWGVESDVVPKEVKAALAHAAWQELTDPHSLNPVYTPHGRVKSAGAGPTSVTFDTSRGDVDGARPVLLSIRDLIGGLLDPAAGSRLSGAALRA